MKIKSDHIAIALALPASAICGATDVVSQEILIPAVLLLVCTAGLSFLSPRRWWLWALIAGGGIPVAHAMARLLGVHPAYPSPAFAETLLAFVPACSGSVFGRMLRGTIEPTTFHSPRNS